MGTRMISPQAWIFDHAAQFFTVSDSRFCLLVDGWLERRLVRLWEGVIGEFEVGGQVTPFPCSPPRYIGVNGRRPALLLTLDWPKQQIFVLLLC